MVADTSENNDELDIPASDSASDAVTSLVEKDEKIS